MKIRNNSYLCNLKTYIKVVMERKMLENCLLAAAIGDIAGQPYEFSPNKNYDEIVLDRDDSWYTDDTVCTFACAEAYINGLNMAENLKTRCLQESMCGYGPSFLRWLQAPELLPPYNSFGNGAAMRCSIAGWATESEEDVIKIATSTAVPTHNHSEGFKGAQSMAVALFWARMGHSKDDICDYILEKYYPDWKDKTYDEVQVTYKFDVTCQGTCPMAILIFRKSSDFEDCMKLCCCSGGDADTLGAIVAPIAYAYYREMPQFMIDHALKLLPMWMTRLNKEFYSDVVERKGDI